MTNDPYDSAMNPTQPARDWYGQMIVNAWFCALVKGTGKVPWTAESVDPNTGKPVRRYTCIDLKLDPMTEQEFPNTVDRSMLAEFGEWGDIVLPSLKELGITSLQSLNNAWVRAELVPTGRTYTGVDGSTKDATTFKFLAVYPDEITCREAYKASRGGASVAEYTPAPAAPVSNNGNRERETAEKFLKPYVQNAWRNSGHDLDKARQALTVAIAGQTLLAKYFTVDSPEVLDLLAAEAA